MNANSWTCDVGQMRGEGDLHDPYSNGTGEGQVKQECCQVSCHDVMNANSWTCDVGQQMRHVDDYHNPYSMGDSESAIKGECCPGTGVSNEGGPPPCIAHCNFDNDNCPSDCDTSACTEASIPPKSWIDTYFANNCSTCITGENCDFSSGCPTGCDYSACTTSTSPTYDEAAYYFANGCKKAPLKCGGGLYIHRKNRPDETCKECAAGKFSSSAKRNRRCKKCGRNKYQNEEGSTSCIKCPPGFNTKGQRGKKQCFDARTGKSMKQLGMYPYLPGWKNQS